MTKPIQEAKAILGKMRYGSPKTRQSYHRIVHQFIKDCYRLKRPFHSVKELTTEDIKGLVSYWQSQKLSFGTMQNRISVVKKYFLAAKHEVKLPDLTAMGIVRANTSKTMPDTFCIDTLMNRIVHPLVKLLVTLQYDFGLTKAEAMNFHISNQHRYAQHVHIDRVHAHNSKDRIIPIVTQRQRETIASLNQYLNGYYDLASMTTKRAIDALYYGELTLLGYAITFPFRKYYIPERLRLLKTTHCLTDAYDMIRIEMGLSSIYQVKAWVKHHE